MPTALEAAHRAGELIRSRFATRLETTRKQGGELVTQVDRDAEACIAACLRRDFPKDSLLAEESGSDMIDAGRLWIVDPIDGTHNFVFGIPHFAVSIAMCAQGAPEIGVVYNPISNDWFVAAKGHGAWWNGNPVRVSPADRLDDVLVATGFYYDRGKLVDCTLQAIREFFGRGICGVRRFGAASLDLAWLSMGRFGVYFEFKLHPWDHAAGQLLVSEAGGWVTDCGGSSTEFIGPGSVLATNRTLHSLAMETLSPAWEALQERTDKPL